MMKTAMWRAISATETEKKAEFGPVQKGWHSSPDAALAAWAEPAAERVVSVKDLTVSDFDPSTATIADVRAFLRDRGAKFGPRTKEDDLRMMAMEAMSNG